MNTLYKREYSSVLSSYSSSWSSWTARTDTYSFWIQWIDKKKDNWNPNRRLLNWKRIFMSSYTLSSNSWTLQELIFICFLL